MNNESTLSSSKKGQFDLCADWLNTMIHPLSVTWDWCYPCVELGVDLLLADDAAFSWYITRSCAGKLPTMPKCTTKIWVGLNGVKVGGAVQLWSWLFFKYSSDRVGCHWYYCSVLSLVHRPEVSHAVTSEKGHKICTKLYCGSAQLLYSAVHPDVSLCLFRHWSSGLSRLGPEVPGSPSRGLAGAWVIPQGASTSWPPTYDPPLAATNCWACCKESPAAAPPVLCPPSKAVVGDAGSQSLNAFHFHSLDLWTVSTKSLPVSSHVPRMKLKWEQSTCGFEGPSGYFHQEGCWSYSVLLLNVNKKQ